MSGATTWEEWAGVKALCEEVRGYVVCVGCRARVGLEANKRWRGGRELGGRPEEFQMAGSAPWACLLHAP